MKNLSYDDLKPQDYLKNFDVKEAKNIFKFRVKMAKFGGNYKGQGPPELCPLCGSHEDNQEKSFQCPKVLDKIKITEDYFNIFETKISLNLSKTITAIVELRRQEEITLSS